MNKLLNFVPWAKRSTKIEPPKMRAEPVSVLVTRSDPIPVAICTDMSEKKRRRSAGFCKTWRPSLDAISENAALKVAPRTATVKGGDEKEKGKAVKGNKPRTRVTIHTGCDDLRHFGPSMMPSFAPTSFLF